MVARPRAAVARQELSSARVTWGPFKGLSAEAIEALDLSSRATDAGVLLPSGVRVIDLVTGPGPQPKRGEQVYVHYKLWAGNFRAGPVADLSFLDGRPYSWTLGMPTDRVPAGMDEGILGMREGGWRRLVVPGEAMFGASGLRRVNQRPGGGRYTGPKAPFVIRPNEPVYVDLIMFDGGSGRCKTLLHPNGVSEKEAAKLKSLTCSYAYEIY